VPRKRGNAGHSSRRLTTCANKPSQNAPGCPLRARIFYSQKNLPGLKCHTSASVVVTPHRNPIAHVSQSSPFSVSLLFGVGDILNSPQELGARTRECRRKG